MAVRIDDADYRLARIRARSAVVDARYALDLEQGRQDVAPAGMGIAAGL